MVPKETSNQKPAKGYELFKIIMAIVVAAYALWIYIDVLRWLRSIGGHQW